ncbi:MalY/PatB family protein [Ferrimonas marina]|uniref:cysteine-S-conjugate beta-lyase n=1 Tax=Ferrimonas marina TaxID=299255 RepID=A0A1M5P9C8_9GAMM|nr:aminotransferase class I/II-fold pyridoxal phosphate-dependent enzyme [Ferrimonas marina]SHG98059.1 cystathione beta-lyase [Ferrimonas marina]
MDPRFDTPPSRQGSDSIKWGRYAGRDVLPFWVADMDFAVAQPIQQALEQRVQHGVFGYAAVPDSLKQACVDWLARRWGWLVPPSHLVAVPAVMPGVNFAVRALESPGALATPAPLYGPLTQVADNLTLPLHRFAVAAEQGWDLDQLERALQQGARTVLLSVPQNPIGQRFTVEQINALGALLERYDARLICDEIHGDLILDGQPHRPLALTPALAQRTLTLISAGKSFNLAGLPFAFAIVADPKWRQGLKRVLQGHAPASNVLAMAATEAAWREGEPWLEALLTYLRGNRALMSEQLDGIEGVQLHRTDATYLAWLDCRALGFDHPARHFERFGVGLSDGSEFGAPGHVRINFGCARATLAEGLKRLKAGIAAA